MTSVIHGYCTLCRSRCGTLNTVDGDQLISVEPDPSHSTGKAMCTKGRAAPEIVHSPHRVFYPLRRTAPKGNRDPQRTFVRASPPTLGDIKPRPGRPRFVRL